MKKALISIFIIILIMISLTATAEDEEFKSDEELSISDILPDDSIWGISIEAFQQTFPGTYKSSNVGNSPALIQEHLNIEGYDMNSYYVFADDSLSKITYILVDDSNKSVVKSCTSHLVSAMETALGTTATKSKGVSKWNNSSIQIGTAKLKNYTGKDSLSACIFLRVMKVRQQNVKSQIKEGLSPTVKPIKMAILNMKQL